MAGAGGDDAAAVVSGAQAAAQYAAGQGVLPPHQRNVSLLYCWQKMIFLAKLLKVHNNNYNNNMLKQIVY